MQRGIAGAKFRELQEALTKLLEKLKSVQYSAALAITGACKGTSRQKIYDEFCWESLKLRRWNCRFVLFYEILNNLTRDYTRSPVSQLQESDYSFHRSCYRANTRENGEIQIEFLPKLFVGMGKI